MFFSRKNDPVIELTRKGEKKSTLLQKVCLVTNNSGAQHQHDVTKGTGNFPKLAASLPRSQCLFLPLLSPYLLSLLKHVEVPKEKKHQVFLLEAVNSRLSI